MTDRLSKGIDAYRHTLMDVKGRDHPDPKSNRPQQLQTHNVPTCDMENANGEN